MMRPTPIAAITVVTFVLTATCHANQPWEDLSEEAQSRVGAAPAQDAAPPDAITTLLEDGVTREEAVRIALMSNSTLQAAFEELGIARADLQQAGLYSNPAIETVLLWPDHEGAEIEIEATWNLADLWRVPIRRKGARARVDQVTMTVLGELLNTAADARMAWDGAVAAQVAVTEATAVRDAAHDLLGRIDERREYGFGEQLDQSRARAEFAEVEMDLATAEGRRNIALARLRRALGLAEDKPLSPTGNLPPPSAEPLPSIDQLLAHALAERPEVQAADLGLRAANLDLRLERRSTWEHVELGPAYTREPDGGELWGFVLGVDLPIADSNQAGRRRAEAERRMAEDRAAAARSMVREEVETAYAHLATATRREAIVRERIIPTREQAHQFAQKHFMQMELSMLPVIETRRELAAARLMHVEARLDAAHALVELQFAVGGRMP